MLIERYRQSDNTTIKIFNEIEIKVSSQYKKSYLILAQPKMSFQIQAEINYKQIVIVIKSYFNNKYI